MAKKKKNPQVQDYPYVDTSEKQVYRPIPEVLEELKGLSWLFHRKKEKNNYESDKEYRIKTFS